MSQKSGFRAFNALLIGLVLGVLPAASAQAAPAKATKAAKALAKPAVKSQAQPASRRAKSDQAGNVARAVARASKSGRVVGVVVKSGGRRVMIRTAPLQPPSFGHLSGLQHADDALDLKSSVALVVDQDTDEILFSKNSHAVLPIASITKLMTALVVTEAGLSMNEMLTVTQEDVDATSGSSSRLAMGTQLTRGEMLHLALMASENRAAHVLGRTYPGGTDMFIPAMNARARLLGMSDTRYVEPTGLSSSNQSSAQDLTRLVRAAYLHPLIRDLSTSQETFVPVGTRQVQFRNTNGLVRNPEWEIGLQKTGYIAAAGRCVVMQAQMAGRKLIMVLLDSAGKYSRMGDAERIRQWLASAPTVLPSAQPR